MNSYFTSWTKLKRKWICHLTSFWGVRRIAFSVAGQKYGILKIHNYKWIIVQFKITHYCYYYAVVQYMKHSKINKTDLFKASWEEQVQWQMGLKTFKMQNSYVHFTNFTNAWMLTCRHLDSASHCYCQLLLLQYTSPFCLNWLGLVISESISTHLIWLQRYQTYQWYQKKKMMTDLTCLNHHCDL